MAGQLWKFDGTNWVAPQRKPRPPGVPPFIIGTSKPDDTNTGLAVSGLTNTDLLIHNGNWTITTPGTVIDGYLIRGLVNIGADNVVIRNCKVVSHTITSFTTDALILSNGNNVLIENCELTQYDDTTSANNSIWYVVGVKLTGGTATVQRNNISNVNDGVYLTSGTHTVMGNYVHDPGFRTDDADQSGNAAHPYWSHNDGVQIRGGINHMIDGNRCVMKFSTLTGMNSTANPSPTAEQVWPNCHGIISDPAFNNVSITIQRNWFEYGACGIHLTQNTYTGNSAYISSNRFTPNQSQEFGVYTQMRIDPTTIWSLTELNNVYSDESDTPIAWRGQPLKAPSVFGTTKAWMFNSGAHTP